MIYKILILIILVGIIYYLFNLRENFDVTSTTPFTQKSNEAIQNIAKIYSDATGTVTFNNVNVNGSIVSSGNITGNLVGNVNGNLSGDVNGNVNGNLVGNVNGSLLSPNGNYKLQIDNSGVIHVLDVSNNDINIIPATGFKGKLISLDETTYIISNPTTGGSGLIIGYDTNGSGKEDVVAGVTYKRARTGA
jgi:hypothetical protein